MANSLVYDYAKLGFATGGVQWNSGTTQVFKVMLVYNTYNPVANTQFLSTITNVSTNEVSGSGYVPGYSGTGRQTLAGVNSTLNVGTDQAQLLANLSTWNSINVGLTPVGWAIVYLHIPSSSDAACTPICAVLLPGVVTNGGNFTIQWSANGIMTIG